MYLNSLAFKAMEGGIKQLSVKQQVHTQNIAAAQHAGNRFDQMQVQRKLSGTDGADQLHKPGTAVVAIDIDHIIDAVRPGAHGAELEVYEIHMVAQQHIGRLQPFHTDLFHLVLHTEQGALAKHPNEAHKEQGLTNGILGGLISFLIFIVHFHIHIHTSVRF